MAEYGIGQTVGGGAGTNGRREVGMVARTKLPTPARLSPVPVEPRSCALPYGLVWDDLRDVLPGFTTPIGARAWVAFDKQGLNGGVTSCILTLGYSLRDGQDQTKTVFVKQAVDPAKAEAARYRYLTGRGIPVARLLTSVTTDRGEVIVLEFLPTIGVHPADADQLLSVVARLNAVADPPGALFTAQAGMPVDAFDARVATALATLGSDSAAAGVVDATRWLDQYKTTEQMVARLPLALNHGELALQQVGLNPAGQVVLFDLETMALLPRFTDIAALVASLAEVSGRRQRDLFGLYLREFTALTGVTLPVRSAWAEVVAVRVVSSFEALPWLMEMADDPVVGFDPGSFARKLGADLAELESHS
jgi:Phosphotransferase enzyme family